MIHAEAIQDRLLMGQSVNRIARELGCAKSTVGYHRKVLGLSKTNRPTFDWHQINVAHQDGMSRHQCMRVFGCSSSAWTDAVKRGDVIPVYEAARTMPDEVLFSKSDRRRNSISLKRRLVRLGILEHRCYGEGCPIKTQWLGKTLVLQLHHVDGDFTNNTVHNLTLLCPNCHSQTSSYGHRNAKTWKNGSSDGVYLSR